MNKSLEMLSKTEVAEKYSVILQPMEQIVYLFYKNQPDMRDSDIQKVYESLLKDIKAKLTNFPAPQHKLEGLSHSVYTQLADFLENIYSENTYSFQEIQLCFKQLEKSLKLWSRQFGIRGYLNYISQFF